MEQIDNEIKEKAKNEFCDKYLSHCDTFKTDLSQLKPLIYKGLRAFCDKSVHFTLINI